MLRLIVLLAFVATLNSVLSDTSSFSSSNASTQASFKTSSSSAYSSASSHSSGSGSSSATATSSSTSSNNNNNVNNDSNNNNNGAKKTPQCGQNEVYDTCPATCPPYTCETKDRQYKCRAPLKPGDPNCKPAGCRCADNYYRNSNGKCVLKNECPQCGRNEVFSSCVNGGCGKRNCTQRLQPALCIDLIEGACRTGCVCQDGFLRTAAGDCVAENECPSNEVCPKPHEYFNLCPASCPARTCGIDDRVTLCAKPPQPGDPDCNPPNCRCEEGYYRTPDGDCVPFEQCPPVCGKNEVPFDCVNSFCLRNKCSQKDLNFICRRKPTNCTAGCICTDGYLRADNGTCVPKDQCPPSCGQFEVYSDCVNGGCDKRNCSQLGRPGVCLDLVARACKKGCVCQKNYLRNADGVCVPIDKCPSSEVCSKPHEYYDQCPATCPARKCGTDDRLVRCKAPLQPGDPNCPLPECRCESGYYRNNYGDCVTFEECSIICGQNEIYYPCPKPTCANQTCENIDKIYNCPLIPANYTCKGECRCQPDFYRNAVGRCIYRDECKQCQGPYEYFDCDNACDNECDKLSYQSHASCPIQNIQCNRMCYCLDGYARNSDKICIPITQCPQSNQTSTPPATVSSGKAVENFNKGNLKFTADFFNTVVKNNPGKSIIISPYSTLILLTQCALYAKGKTQRQLFNAFNLNSVDEIKAAIPAILNSIEQQRNVTLTLAERVYGNKRSSFSEPFKKDTQEIYKAEAENIDMSNGAQAAKYMNEWVASKTNNKITDLIPASLITPDTEMVLVNAIYCLVEWQNKFNVRNTRPSEFSVSEDKKVTLDFMSQVIYVKYAESAEYNSKVVELPYVNSNLTCLILLPNDIGGAPRLVSQLVDENAFKSIRSALQQTRVNIILPKFNSTTTTDLKEVLQKINITELFNPNSSGLSGILADPTVNIDVTAGIQKANIIINESGSEASAANAIIGVATSSVQEPPKNFNADHAFVYYLYYQETPIFCGLFAGN